MYMDQPGRNVTGWLTLQAWHKPTQANATPEPRGLHVISTLADTPELEIETYSWDETL